MPHLTAISVMMVWGATFVSTKVLLSHGLSPSWIFFIRFATAYIGLWALCFRYPVRPATASGSSVGPAIGHSIGQSDCSTREIQRTSLFPGGWKHELLFLLLGVTGGSLYFLAENNALEHTQACNVSFIVSSAPLLVTILTILVRKYDSGQFSRSLEPVQPSLTLALGTIMAFSGMDLILFEGHLNLSLRGDLLSLCAAMSWATYSLFMSSMTGRYGALLSTRKVFFYGLLTIIPVLLSGRVDAPPLSVLLETPVLLNLLFLGIVASLICFVGWNWAMHRLGNVTTTNYVYSNPLFTLAAAVLILGERMSLSSAIGSALILAGVILAGKRRKITKYE